jgi:hypothetical protein
MISYLKEVNSAARKARAAARFLRADVHFGAEAEQQMLFSSR